jgi:hypothetical protein
MSENGGCHNCDYENYYLLKCCAGEGEGKKAKVHPITGYHGPDGE